MKLISHRSFTMTSGCKTLVYLGATLTLNLALISSAQAAEFADFIFLVDESGSMAGEHSWLRTTIGDLDTALQAKGVGTGTEENRYGLVGFGGATGTLGRSLPVGGSLFGNAAELATSSNFLVTTGGFEDGYSAIDYTLNNYSFRDGAAVNFVLVTDEDRDNGNDSLNFDNILSGLQEKNALLNVVVNHQMTEKNGRQAIGADRDGNVFLADGNGGYSTIVDGLNSPATQGNNQFGSYPGHLHPWLGKSIPWANYGFGNTTKSDYVDLAWATGNSTISGAAWDLNLLRSGGQTANSFNAAFVEIKATEALKQTGNGVEEKRKIPEPATVLGLLGVAALGIRKRCDRASTRG